MCLDFHACLLMIFYFYRIVLLSSLLVCISLSTSQLTINILIKVMHAVFQIMNHVQIFITWSIYTILLIPSKVSVYCLAFSNHIGSSLIKGPSLIKRFTV